MPEWKLTPEDLHKGERFSRRKREEIYRQIRKDLRLIKTEITDKGDLILGIPSGRRVLITQENAIKFAKWILAVMKKRKNG